MLFILLNIVIAVSCTTDVTIGDRESVDVIPLEQDDPVPEACGPFVNVTRISDTEGYFYSPGYPNNYPGNIDCFLVLEAKHNQIIRIDFRDHFDIETSTECKHDYLEVRDGPYGFSEPAKKICLKGQFPDEIISQDRYLWIHFQSDDTIEGKGFKAIYQFTERTSETPEIWPCVMNITDKEEGTFGLSDINNQILVYNNRTKQQFAVDCLWIITVKKNWRIYLQFAEFFLEHPNECNQNFVQVYPNRSVAYIQKHKVFCGSIAESTLSIENKMFVRFMSVGLGPKTKFQANFTAYRQVGQGQHCDEQSEFYCEDDTCIDKLLKCNERYNCRTRFDEEDDDCHSAVPPAWNGDHIVIIMVIFSLILTGMCITFVYNCITKLIRDHRTIQEFIRASHEQQLNELGKLQEQMEKKPPSKAGNRSHSSPSIGSNRFDAVVAVNCYVPGDDVLPIPVRNDRERSIGPLNGDAYTTNIYTVDNESPPQMCDSACQTRESLFTTQEYSSGNSSPTNHSIHTNNSPPAPFSTFGYKKPETKFKAEAKIEMVTNNKRRPYSVQTTKSAPDVIVTH